MGDPNVLASEKIAVCAALDPVSVSTVQYTGAIDMSIFHQALGIFSIGVVGDGAITCQVFPCNSAGNARGSALKAASMTESSGSCHNKQIVIGIRGEELLDQATYNRYVQFAVTCAGTGLACVIGLGVDCKYGPASDHDSSTVVEIEDDLG
jgi:hypothetical protein